MKKIPVHHKSLRKFLSALILSSIFLVVLFYFLYPVKPLDMAFNKMDKLHLTIWSYKGIVDEIEVKNGSDETQKLQNLFNEYNCQRRLGKTLNQTVEDLSDKSIHMVFWKNGTLVESCYISQDEMIVGGEHIYQIQEQDQAELIDKILEAVNVS